jgi:hypothetical protein
MDKRSVVYIDGDYMMSYNRMNYAWCGYDEKYSYYDIKYRRGFRTGKEDNSGLYRLLMRRLLMKLEVV